MKSRTRNSLGALLIGPVLSLTASSCGVKQYAFSSETHHAFNQLEQCFEALPVIGSVEPEEAWHWKGWGSYKITYSSPVAGDLLGDGRVKIVSVPSPSNYTSVNGPIVVLDGATGQVEWNSMENPQQIGLSASTTPALVDLDGDRVAEIIGVTFVSGSSQGIAIVDYAKRTVRTLFTDGFSCGSYCMVATADIDGDGRPEIVAGNTVLNSDGTLKFRLPSPGMRVPVPTLAKLIPGQPGLQIIFGSRVHSSTGELLWSAPSGSSCTGFTAVADLVNDGKPELICVAGGHTHLYEFDSSGAGTLKWKKPIPRPAGVTSGSNIGGAPNVGRFLGNGELQFGLAGGDFYLVYDVLGNEIWRQATFDHSSSSTGSTVFDLNGDGKVEVLYNDEKALRIYEGTTGKILWSAPNPSGTLWEYPLIVDANGDRSADIIVSAPGLGGVRMFTDPSQKWVNTREVWNQYSYFPELVDDRLQATLNPRLPKEGFRVNTQGRLPSGELVCK